MEGVDYSWGRPDLATMYALGVRFVCRYLAPLSGKVLSPAERRALHGAGFSIILNWENEAKDMLGGYGLGATHATEALRQADELGAPIIVPIFFSVDFDAIPADYEPIARYLDGAASVLGRPRVGVYGKADVIDALVPRYATWGWQTYAWSAGRISRKAHLLQYRNNVSLAGATVDLDRSLREPFGAWEPGMVWYKASWIPTFFDALNAIAPNRDRGTDGTIGDPAHQGSSSGHNPDDTPGSKAEREDDDQRPEVRAADASNDLRSLITMQQVINAILAYPPDRNRLIYIIHDGLIWSANNGWKPVAYPGSDKHRTHVHLSGNPNSDLDGRPWQSILNLGADMEMNDPVPGVPGLTVGVFMRDVWTNLVVTRGLTVNATGVPMRHPDDRWAQPHLLTAQTAKLDALIVAFTTLATAITDAGGSVDTAAILAGVDERLAVLAAEQRDAVADLGEGGAAQVRADAP